MARVYKAEENSNIHQTLKSPEGSEDKKNPLAEMQAKIVLAMGVLVGLFITVELQLITVSSTEPSSPISEGMLYYATAWD